PRLVHSLQHPVRRPRYLLFFFRDTATSEIYTLSLHDALPILRLQRLGPRGECLVLLRYRDLVTPDREPDREAEHRHERHRGEEQDRKSTRLNSSHVAISYAVFCLKKKNQHKKQTTPAQAQARH